MSYSAKYGLTTSAGISRKYQGISSQTNDNTRPPSTNAKPYDLKSKKQQTFAQTKKYEYQDISNSKNISSSTYEALYRKQVLKNNKLTEELSDLQRILELKEQNSNSSNTNKLKSENQQYKLDLTRIRQQRDSYRNQTTQIKRKYNDLLEISLKTAQQYQIKIIQLSKKIEEKSSDTNSAYKNLSADFKDHRLKLKKIFEENENSRLRNQMQNLFEEKVGELNSLIEKCRGIKNSLSSVYELKKNLLFSMNEKELKKIQDEFRKHKLEDDSIKRSEKQKEKERQKSENKELILLKEHVNGLFLNLQFLIIGVKEIVKSTSVVVEKHRELKKYYTEIDEILQCFRTLCNE